MDIIYNEIQGLDFFVILNLSEKAEEKVLNQIKLELEKWCNYAIEKGYGDGYMHYIHHIDYNEDYKLVFALIDMGSMNPEIGFNALSVICDGINIKFGRDVISNIEINGSDDIMYKLMPS
jgi:hypothetical protein